MQTLISMLPSLTDLATAPSEVMLIARCTILLAAAWTVHGLLACRNPRARVLLWRATMVGVVALPMLACLPPTLTWRLPDLEQPSSTAVPETAPSTGQPPLAAVVEEATPRISEPFPEAATTTRSSQSPAPPTSRHGSTGDEAATGPSIQMPASVSVRAWLWIVWAPGVVFLSARLIWSHAILARLVARSRAAPDHIQQACHVVADRLGCRQALGVLVSGEITSPCLAGILHPTVLLPERVCQPTDHDDLQAILAHELAHVRGGDLAWNLAAHATSILLWFNPLAWRIRAAHAGACEAVCDAVAADLLNDVPRYSRTLARLALQIAPAPPSAGLAMARVSHVRSRILALNRRLFRTPLRRCHVVPALCLGAVLLGAIGSVGFAGPEKIASPSAALATNEEQPQPQPAKKLHGRVVLPDGTSAAGIEVGLGTVHLPIALEAGRLPRTGKFPRATTAVDGTFAIDSSAERSILIASGEAGYGSVILAPESMEIKTGKIVLQPWSKIAGHAILAGKPVPDHEVVYLPGSEYLRREGSGRNFFTDSEYKANTDKEGRFVFERVPPGGGVAYLPIVTDLGGGKTQRLRCWPLAFRFLPGATAEIKLGATGRTVVGKVVLDGNPKVHIDWTKNKPVQISLQPDPAEQPIFPPRKTGPPAFAIYATKLDADGRFRIEDVPLGRYRLILPVTRPFDPNIQSEFTEIGRATLSFGLPEPISNREKEPFDLGTIKAVLDHTIEVGDRVPPPLLHSLNGKPLQRSELQGKLTLLHFWSPAFIPGLADQSTWKEIYRTFGSNPRFFQIGVVCEDSAELARQAVEQNGFSWLQLSGGKGGGAALGYWVREIPSVFLLGPDGRILAKNLKGAELKEAVQKALADEMLFSAGNKEWQEEFPVRRFGPEGPDASAAKQERPAFLVLESRARAIQSSRMVTPETLAEATGNVTLRLLSETGKELRSLPGADRRGGLIANHCLAIDTARERFYLVGHLFDFRSACFDFHGHKLWQMEKRLPGDRACVDPKTGSLWCTRSNGLTGPREYGITVVLDEKGTMTAALPVGGNDIAYDPRADAFWLANSAIVKLSRDGRTLLRIPSMEASFQLVSVNPTDGSAWVVEDDRLGRGTGETKVWHVDAEGKSLAVWKKTGLFVMALACDRQTGNVWIAGGNTDIIRLAPDGKELAPIPFKATSLSISPTTGRIWAATKTEILQLDRKGKLMSRFAFKSPATYAWVGAF